MNHRLGSNLLIVTRLFATIATFCTSSNKRNVLVTRYTCMHMFTFAFYTTLVASTSPCIFVVVREPLGVHFYVLLSTLLGE